MTPGIMNLLFPYLRIAVTCLLVVLWGQTMASETGSSVKKFNRETWEDATRGLDYGEKKKMEEKKPGKMKPWFNFNWNGGIPASVLKPLFFSLVIILLAWVIYRIFSGSYHKRKKVRNAAPAFFVEELNHEVPHDELEDFLRDAIEKKSFRLAVRLYYLILIRELSGRNWISWKKDKTNNQYLEEMRERAEYSLFRDITLLFERVWYGNRELGEKEFHSLSPYFNQLIMAVKSPIPAVRNQGGQ